MWGPLCPLVLVLNCFLVMRCVLNKTLFYLSPLFSLFVSKTKYLNNRTGLFILDLVKEFFVLIQVLPIYVGSARGYF